MTTDLEILRRYYQLKVYFTKQHRFGCGDWSEGSSEIRFCELPNGFEINQITSHTGEYVPSLESKRILCEGETRAKARCDPYEESYFFDAAFIVKKKNWKRKLLNCIDQHR